ncbi:hypothetical protein PFRA20S_03446 [Pseudomonas fragi]|nr:hypothetical protein SAMN05216594_4785 [Pseudomonas fragi]
MCHSLLRVDHSDGGMTANQVINHHVAEHCKLDIQPASKEDSHLRVSPCSTTCNVPIAGDNLYKL